MKGPVTPRIAVATAPAYGDLLDETVQLYEMWVRTYVRAYKRIYNVDFVTSRDKK